MKLKGNATWLNLDWYTFQSSFKSSVQTHCYIGHSLIIVVVAVEQILTQQEDQYFSGSFSNIGLRLLVNCLSAGEGLHSQNLLSNIILLLHENQLEASAV